MNSQDMRQNLKKYILKTENDVNRNYSSKKKLCAGLIDTQTSLIIHKNLIINLIKECVTNKLKPFDEANPSNELADKLADLLIIKGSNDQVVDKFIFANEDKVRLNKAYYMINYSTEMKRKKRRARFVYYSDMCKRIESKLTEKKVEVEGKVKEHDKIVASSSLVFKKESYIHFPTKHNIELYVEKTQGLEILNKLTEIMKAEKQKYNSYQDKIKQLIKRISMSSREIKTYVDESSYSGKDKYNSGINNYTTNQVMIGEASPAINDHEAQEEEEFEDEADCNIDISFDSANLRFPDKIKPIKLIGDSGDLTTKGEVPKLNFENIHSKYLNDQNVIVKEDKKEGNKLIKEANEILINLLDGDKKKDVELEEYRKEIKNAEKRISDLKECISILSSAYKINKRKALRLNESTQNTNLKISKLTREIEELKQEIKDARFSVTSNLAEVKEESISAGIQESQLNSKGEMQFDDEIDENFDDVNFDVFAENK